MWQKIKMVIKKMLGVYLGMITFALTIAVISEIMKHNIGEMLLGIAMTTFFAFLTYLCFKKTQSRNNVITSTQSQNANNGNDIVSTFAATSQEMLHNNADIPKTTEESVKYLGPRDNTIIVQTDEQNIANEEISHNVTLNKPQPAHNLDITPVTSQEIQQNSTYYKETTDKVTGYVTTENIITQNDEKEISDEDIPYLMQIGYENALKKEDTYPKRTSREEDLCVNFMMNHSFDIQHHVDKFEELYRKAYTEQNLDLKIEMLKQTIIEYEKAKKWFYRTKGGTIYFEDMYEHLHNSKIPDFSYIDSVQEYLDYNVHKKDVTIPQILSAIGDNGIIQKNIYEFVDSDKSDIQKVIRELESENKILREKKGNSYLLTLK